MGDEDVKGFDEVASAAPADEARQWVVWDNRFAFESRSLQPKDLVGLGADESEDSPLEAVEWNSANNWRVPREQLKLTDLQLGQFLGVDKSFRLVER